MRLLALPFSSFVALSKPFSVPRNIVYLREGSTCVSFALLDIKATCFVSHCIYMPSLEQPPPKVSPESNSLLEEVHLEILHTSLPTE